jgi:CheY-like chemotaxis protein
MKISTGSALQSRKVAVVEEAADNIYSMRFILQSLGYQVISLPFQTDYLSLLEEFQPDLVLIDTVISTGDALRVIAEIRSDKILKETCLVAVTAAAAAVDATDLEKAGVRCVLTKPYTVAELQTALNQCLNCGK